MVYRSGTDEGSSGGPILKGVKGDLKIVGLHRGGHLDDWDDKGASGFNFGSLFTEIYKSIHEDWHPLGNYEHMRSY